MKIFLTGASGFIGKNFYKLAIKKGYIRDDEICSLLHNRINKG